MILQFSTVEDLANQIVDAREQGPRASTYRMTFMNRSPRTLRRIRREADKIALRCELDAGQLWSDIKDMAELAQYED